MDLPAEYIQGALTVTADLASCDSGFNKEWRLIPTKILVIFAGFMEPFLLIFLLLALTLSLPPFFSWKPDPAALGTDAFSIA